MPLHSKHVFTDARKHACECIFTLMQLVSFSFSQSFVALSVFDRKLICILVRKKLKKNNFMV